MYFYTSYKIVGLKIFTCVAAIEWRRSPHYWGEAAIDHDVWLLLGELGLGLMLGIVCNSYVRVKIRGLGLGDNNETVERALPQVKFVQQAV